MLLTHLSKQNLHHTNICIGNRTDIITDIDTLISDYSKSISKIERLLYEFDKFLIRDAEHIFSRHIHKVGEDEIQIIIIACNSTNRETQNSMLKIFEEPPAHTYFFVVVPNKNTILPTVLSRAQIFEYKTNVEISEETKKFINTSISKRLEIVKKIVENIKDEKQTKQEVVEFIEELEKYIHEQKNITLLKRVIEIKGYLKDQGASVKQLLEYLAVQI